MSCSSYEPNKIFENFRVIEFPFTFVDISNEVEIDVGVNLNKSAFMVTSLNGKIMRFEEAQASSPAHRAFEVRHKTERLLKIRYHPTKACVSWTRVKKDMGNKFICDLRFIRVDGNPCCSNPRHAEVVRIYLCGHYEYCELSHSPQEVDFGEMIIGQTLSKHIMIRNDSSLPAVLEKNAQPIVAHHVNPIKLTIPAKSSRKLFITIKPTCLKVENIVKINITNGSNMLSDTEDNFIPYDIPIRVKVAYNKKPIQHCRAVESLKHLYELNPSYAFMGDELEQCNEKRKIALQLLQKAKRPLPFIKLLAKNNRCISTMSLYQTLQADCESEMKRFSMYDLLDISLLPLNVEFGKIALNSHSKKKLTIYNNTSYEIIIKFMKNKLIYYTDLNVKTISLNLRPNTQQTIIVFCRGDASCHSGTFKYNINQKYFREHHYNVQAGNPSLTLKENNFKLGIVNQDNFITSTSVRITNEYNVSVNFTWDDLPADAPFEIMPKCGSVPKYSTKYCNISYICKQSKKLHYVINFRSLSEGGNDQAILPVEVTVLLKKLSLKFLEQPLYFKDVPLNLETTQEVILENSSREFATFFVVEPLIKGFRVEPKSGIIRPKMMTLLKICVKLPSVMDFNVEINLKLNNKETLTLCAAGNVLEPKIVIYPKMLHLPRIPSNMLTYVPLTFQNLGSVKTLIDVIQIEDDDGCDKMFELYVAHGNEKHKISQFYMEGSQSKTIYLKVCEEYRREFEFFLPIQVNGLLGPPNIETALTDLQSYTRPHSYYYENLNPQTKLNHIRREICNCRVTGVITVPWLKFSLDSFDIVYTAGGDNMIEFTVTNISRRLLYIIISTAKLGPTFTLYVIKGDKEQIGSIHHIAFELDVNEEVFCTLKFHPKGRGFFTATATIFVDNCMGTPYSNLTFTGTRKIPSMSANTHRVVFPPCVLGMEIEHHITLKLEGQADKSSFFCESREEKHLCVKFMDARVTAEDDEIFTKLDVHINICCNTSYSRVLLLNFCNENGATCEVEIGFCYVQCPLTLHVNNVFDYNDNTYPFYPTKNDKVYDYMERTLEFLEKWMFIQGYRRDFFPQIPESFYALSQKCGIGLKPKSATGHFSNFVKRLAGPLIKYSRRATVYGMDEVFKHVLEVYDSYEDVIKLLKARGCHLWIIQARFLLNFEQFSIYCNNVTSKTNADILLTRELLDDPDSYYRLSKLAWMEFVVQCYRAFVLNCCFLDCACPKIKNRDVVKVLIGWYNKHIEEQQFHLRGQNKPIKTISNLTTDMSDGIAIMSVLLHYCPFMRKHFKCFSEVEGSDEVEGCIINNTCLIDDALKHIRILFPLTYLDFLEPSFVPMLFLSIHLYTVLPMFYPRDIIRFKPPLLRSSARLVTVYPSIQESLMCSLLLLNNKKNNFMAEKAHFGDYNKKVLVKVKYTANFVDSDNAILLVQGTNKTRLFDTYVLFLLEGQTGALYPLKKCKVSGQIYRQNKVEIGVMSPFCITATFDVTMTEKEPHVPVDFGNDTKRRFFLRCLNLTDRRVTLNAAQKGLTDEENEHRLLLQMVCLSSCPAVSYIWFRSEVGEFYIKVVATARCDIALDTLRASVRTWPLEPCSCGEDCKCYRSTVVMIPHRNELMVRAMRCALLEYATPDMVAVFDRYIHSEIGRGIIGMLLVDGGTDMSQVAHILREQTQYKVTSRTLVPQNNQVTLDIHSDELMLIPITLSAEDKIEKFSFNMTSDCGMDMRLYRVLCAVDSLSTTEIEELEPKSESEVCCGEMFADGVCN